MSYNENIHQKQEILQCTTYPKHTVLVCIMLANLTLTRKSRKSKCDITEINQASNCEDRAPYMKAPLQQVK